MYGTIGALNTAMCYTLFALLVRLCAWHHHLALVADYALGIVIGYSLHRVSTFADRQHLRQAFGKYLVTVATTFLANLMLLDVMVRVGLLEPLLAQALGLTAVTLAGYLIQTHWVFRQHARGEKSPGHADRMPADDPLPSRRQAA